MKKIRALIVQRFPDVRATLREMIATERDIVLLGEYEDGASAIRSIRKHRPQLLFLGIQLRDMDGFEVLQLSHRDRPPVTIFVSKFEHYAVRAKFEDHAVQAFSSHAVDYLLKPFTRERFKEAIMRARFCLQSPIRREQRVANSSAHPKSPQLLGVKVRGRIVLLKPDEIEAIVARRTYSTVHATNGTHEARTSLSAFQRKLSAAKFIRINRSTLINAHHVKAIARKAHGDGLLSLASGREFPLSRRYREQWSALMPAKVNSPPRTRRDKGLNFALA